MLVELRRYMRYYITEGARRSFHNEFFDLFVWYDANKNISSFQLCYDKFNNERSLTWGKDGYFTHECLDEKGELLWGKRKFFIKKKKKFEKDLVVKRFQTDSRTIDDKIASFVLSKICEYKN